jgi:predicted ATP-dependent endonuclease of OLD family
MRFDLEKVRGGYMSHIIKEILINENVYKNYFINDGSDEKSLKNISKINILIGANNSGKSRMLRTLFKEENFYFKTSIFNIDAVKEEIKVYKRDILSIADNYSFNQFDEFSRNKFVELDELNYIQNDDNFLSAFYESTKTTSSFTGNPIVSYSTNIVPFFNYEQIKSELRAVTLPRLEKVNELVGNHKKIRFKKVYIPTLRGLRGVGEYTDFYADRTKNDYFTDKPDVEIFTGLKMYSEVKSLLLGNLKERNTINDFQSFIGENFFDGQEIALIPNEKSDVLFVKIGDEEEKPIYNLGDGIQSLIIFTFPLFKYFGENLILFIEEPELYLHPGLQRKFLEVIMKSKFDGYQYFFTTHSNYFLDMTLDMDNMSIYSFKKELEDCDSLEKNANFIIENVNNEEKRVLEMLGVRNSAVFLSNCTIWVEGITDRYYIRHFFDIYQKSLANSKVFKEDIHFSFVEYSGNNITHWTFLDDENTPDGVFSSMNPERLCGTIFLITDKDSEKKRERQEKLVEKLNERYYCLQCKEIENILSPSILRKVIADYEGKKVAELSFKTNFIHDTYKNKYLGRFIEKQLNNKVRRGSYSSDSGTVSDKVGFCKKAISHIDSIEDLSEETVLLCRKIYEFINSNNL